MGVLNEKRCNRLNFSVSWLPALKRLPAYVSYVNGTL